MIPVLLYSTRLLSNRIERSIADLEEIEVTVPAPGRAGESLIGEIRDQFRRYGVWIAALAVLVTVVFLVGDTWPLVEWTQAHIAATTAGDPCGPGAIEMDWTTGFADRACWTGLELAADFEPTRLWANVAFNAYAYFLEGLWVFIALLTIAKIAPFFFLMADFFGREEGQFRIEPLWDDPLQRLGLTPLGNIYNLMLTMLLLFEGYVVLHRLQRVALTQQIGILDYVRELTPGRGRACALARSPTAPDVLHRRRRVVLDPADRTPRLHDLLVSALSDPQLHRRAPDPPDQGIRLARKRAPEAGDEAATEAFDRKTRALDVANVWPNGDRAVWRFLFSMIALWIGSIVPMAFLVLATIMAVPEILSLTAELVARVLHRQRTGAAISDEL